MSFLREHCSLFSVNEPKELGSDVLDFIKIWFIEPLNKTGCRFVIVDAYNTPQTMAFMSKMASRQCSVQSNRRKITVISPQNQY